MTICYCFPLGMIISVGGLTESVVKASGKALIDWIRNSLSETQRLGHFFLEKFDQHTKDGRVILPLLKTVEKLLSHECLNPILSDNEGFPSELFIKIQRETYRCTDMQRLFAIASVLIGLLPSEKILKYILSRFLCHKYPRLRRHTAEILYMKLLECDEDDRATQFLLEVDWGQSNVFREANVLADIFGVTLPKQKKEVKQKKSHRIIDEFESYSSLVNDAGR